MTPEAQRIAIAEACPQEFYFDYEKDNQGNILYVEVRSWRTHTVVDPLTDLNAMHEVEKTLKTKIQKVNYLVHLNNISVRDPEFATASQRAEAFLRTIGKWEE